MLEQRWRLVGGEVVTTLTDLRPIRHVQDRRGHVTPDTSQRGAALHDRKDQHRGNEHEQRRQQAARTSCPEPSDRQPVGSLDLGDREAGDQEPRDHEEHVDADEPARHDAGVKEEDCAHCYCAEAVERREIHQTGPAVGAGGTHGRH